VKLSAQSKTAEWLSGKVQLPELAYTGNLSRLCADVGEAPLWTNRMTRRRDSIGLKYEKSPHGRELMARDVSYLR